MTTPTEIALASYIKICSTFNCCESLVTGEGLAMLYSGSPAASENYALPPRAERDGAETARMIRGALRYFGARPFCMPIFDGSKDEALALSALGGSRSQAHAMSISASSANRRPDGARIIEAHDAHRWADACWLGFDSGEPAPPSFVRFVEQAARCGQITLAASHDGDEIASTGMIVLTAPVAGIFYVATLPERRGEGRAAAVVSVLLAEAERAGVRQTALLATGAGEPLYRSLGFSHDSTVEIFSFGADLV